MFLLHIEIHKEKMSFEGFNLINEWKFEFSPLFFTKKCYPTSWEHPRDNHHNGLGSRGWSTPRTCGLTTFALNVYDVYIVINHGVKLKEKSPSSINVLCSDD